MGIKSFVTKSHFLYIICIGLILVGCSSTKMSFDVTTLPENPLSDPVNTIALVNGLNLNNAQTNQFVNGNVVAQFNGSTDYVVKQTFLKMESLFNNGQYFKAYDTTLNFLPKSKGFRSKTMPVVLMNKACRVTGTDAIVTVEAYTADIDSDSEVRYSTPVDRNYGTVRVPYFDGEQSAIMRMLFRAYSCKSNPGELDFQTEVSTQVSRSTTGSSPYEVNQNMRSSGSILLEAAENIAIDFSQQIGPRTESVSRKIYIKGNDQMAEAYRMAGIGDWQGANDIWYLLATSRNKSMASKATYNLVVGNEAILKYAESIELAKICRDRFEMKKMDAYILNLESRQKEVIKLQRLFPSIIL